MASVRCCCCTVILIPTFLFLLFIAVPLVILSSVKTQKPQFHIQQVDLTTSSLLLNASLIYTVANTNNVGIKYGDYWFTVFYGGIPLGNASVPGFYLPPRSEREVVVDFTMDIDVDLKDLELEMVIIGNVGVDIRVVDFDSPCVQFVLHHHYKLTSSQRTRAEPLIYYAFNKTLGEDATLVRQPKEKSFQEWKDSRRAELSEYQNQTGELNLANVEKEMERWKNLRNTRRGNNNNNNMMNQQLETHRLEHGPKTRKIPGGNDNEDENDVVDINVAGDDLMGDVLGVDEKSEEGTVNSHHDNIHVVISINFGDDHFMRSFNNNDIYT